VSHILVSVRRPRFEQVKPRPHLVCGSLNPMDSLPFSSRLLNPSNPFNLIVLLFCQTIRESSIRVTGSITHVGTC
jgi:hypothetical protein